MKAGKNYYGNKPGYEEACRMETGLNHQDRGCVFYSIPKERWDEIFDKSADNAPGEIVANITTERLRARR